MEGQEGRNATRRGRKEYLTDKQAENRFCDIYSKFGSVKIEIITIITLIAPNVTRRDIDCHLVLGQQVTPLFDKDLTLISGQCQRRDLKKLGDNRQGIREEKKLRRASEIFNEPEKSNEFSRHDSRIKKHQ